MTQYTMTQAQLEAQQTASPAYQRLLGLLDEQSYVSLDSYVVSDPQAGISRPGVAGDGVYIGSGTIDNRLVYVAAQDPSVYGGSMGQRHAGKIIKAIELARASGVPFIGLYETGGVRIDEGLAALEAVSNVLQALQAASSEIPLLSVVYGPCVGSAALFAGLSDLTILAADRGALTLNGPGVLAALANQPLTPVDLGGYAVQGKKTGLAALAAATASDLPALVRQVFAYLPDTAEGFTFALAAADDPNRCELALDELAAGLDDGIDLRRVVEAVFDLGSFLELSPEYAVPALTGLARLDGRVVGVAALSGSRLNGAMADKLARFIQLCDRLNLPLINLLDTAGYELSAAAEQAGLVTAATRLFAAGSTCRIPRLTVAMGELIGPAYVSLASRGAGNDWLLAWPTATLAPTTADTAAHILAREEIAAAADPISARRELAERYAATQASPQAGAALGLVDEIIAPSATRPRLISALQLLA